MIPRIIHYCWFGQNPLPPLAVKCIESWKRYCPGYEIKEWSEDNFDIHCCQYVEEAYSAKKWAFVTDYVRLYVLKEFGGIYMDTDVEVLKPLDRFLVHPAFSGFEQQTSIPTGIIASEKKNLWISHLLSYYKERSFIKPDGNYDFTTNVEIITKMTTQKYRFTPNNTYQQLSNDVVLYPTEYFCPKNYLTGETILTINSHTIHHFNGSWLTRTQKIKTKMRKAFGEKIWNILFNIKNSILYKIFIIFTLITTISKLGQY